MAEVVLKLPLGKRKPRSVYHDHFTSVSDGRIYKINRSEFTNESPEKFRVRLRTWAKNRKKLTETRIDEDGNLYVQMRDDPGAHAE